jgi:hypothetical protein
MFINAGTSFSALALTPSVLLHRAALRRPLFEQGLELPVQPALEIAQRSK